MKKRNLNHLEEHNIIPKEQYGFRNGRSIGTALLQTSSNNWSATLNCKESVDIVY